MPGVEPDVVVIAARRDEPRARVAPDHHVEAEHTVVKGLGLSQVRDLKVNVSDRGPGRCRDLELGGRLELVEPCVQRGRVRTQRQPGNQAAKQ